LLAGCDDTRAHGRPDLDIIVDVDMATPPAPPCVLAGATRLLSDLDGQHAYPRIASNGVGYVVAWVSYLAGTPSTFRIDAAVTDLLGDVLGPNLPMSAQAIATADPPSVTPISSGTSVAWTRATGTSTDLVLTTLDVHGQKLDANGAACDPADDTCSIFPITASGTASAPFLDRPNGDKIIAGTTEDQLAVAFLDTRNYPCTLAPCSDYNDVFWKRVQSNGTELIHEKQLTTTGLSHYTSPGLAFDGVHEGIHWQQNAANMTSNLFFSTLDAFGNFTSLVQQLGSVSGTSAPSTPDLVWAAGGYALASASGTDATATVLFQRQNSNGTANLAPKAVTFEGADCAPAIAYDGTNYAIAYQLGCGTIASAVAFIRIAPDGTRLQLDGTSCGANADPACGRLYIATPSANGSAARPQMVIGADGAFTIVWMQGLAATPGGASATPLDVYLQRVTCN
jgi:hypothetical protein